MTDQNQQSLLLGKIAAYTEILVKDSNSTIFVSLGETYRKMGMLDDARQIISKGLTLHSDFSPAYIVLARTLCQLEDYSGSVVAFKRALDLDVESLAALVGYARVQILLGEEQSARELLLKARHLTPADPIINKLLLSLPDVPDLKDQGIDVDTDQGVEPVDNSTSLVSSTLADLYLAQGLSQKALHLYQRLSVKSPDDLSLRRRVKELERQLKDENSVVLDKDDTLQTEPLQGTIDSDDSFTVAEPEVEHHNGTAEDEVVVESVIETFNRWLHNIQRRRGNV
jgi:tetratricopeptide (TPR) repeat protein